MKSTAMFKFAASAIVLSGTMVTANPIGFISGIAAAADANKIERVAADAASRAQKALKAKDGAKAIIAAEEAVEAAPRDAGYRALLGQSYLQGGRLFSAETAFRDAIALNPGDGRSTLSLALVQIALGKPEAGLRTLNDSTVPIAAADHGLALALAGDSEAALAMLEPAARAEGVSAKIRQNLALAYALSGQWAQARVIAAQDVPADQLDRRMLMWAGFANPSNSWEQVAGLLGVSPVFDGGQPERLALLAQPDVQTAATEAAPVIIAVPETRMAETTPVPEPMAIPEPVVLAAAAAPVSEITASSQNQQTVFAPRREIVQPVQAAYVRPAAAIVVKPRYAAETRVAPVSGGKFVVQLGAYSTEAKAEQAWKSAVGRYDLSAYAANGTMFRTGNGTVHRAAVGGFATRQDATRVCASVKAKGGECFVRAATNDAPALWAQRASGVRIAAR